METDKSRVLTATKQLMDTLSSVIDKCAKEVEQDGAIKFSHNSGRPDKGIRQATMPVAELYVDWLTAVGVKTRKEMDELLASFSDDSEMLKCAEDLQKVEQRFDALTKQVNVVVQQEEDTMIPSETVTKGDYLPKQLQLTDLDSGNKVSIDSILSDSPYTLLILNRHYA